MVRKLFICICLILILLAGCEYSPLTPTVTPSLAATSTNTATVTLTPTVTLTSTITATYTATIIPFEIGIFQTPGPFKYYSNPSLLTSLGEWDDKFFICAQYFSATYNSYEIARSQEDCINRNVLGWVKSDRVILSIGRVPEFRMTVVVAGAMQCGDAIDNDDDVFYDMDDSDCADINDNLENPTPLPTFTPPPPPPNEKVRITRPASGTEVHCASGAICSISVNVSWDNPAPGNQLCIFVHPEEGPGQPYYSQFEGTSGQAYIGPAPNNTSFEIIAVSTSSVCGGTILPRGENDSVSVIRIND